MIKVFFAVVLNPEQMEQSQLGKKVAEPHQNSSNLQKNLTQLLWFINHHVMACICHHKGFPRRICTALGQSLIK
jgi:hypothetical protein